MSATPSRLLVPISLLTLLGALVLSACAQPSQPGPAAPLATAAENVATPRDVACPSQDFAVFLPVFANDDAVRAGFTRQPLELVVRAHRAAADAPAADRDGMAITTDAEPAAHEVFAYRYDAKLGRYEHVGTPLEPLAGEFVADPEWAFDFDIDAQSADEVRISAGPEPERKTFVFSRSAVCWTLSRAYDFGD